MTKALVMTLSLSGLSACQARPEAKSPESEVSIAAQVPPSRSNTKPSSSVVLKAEAEGVVEKSESQIVEKGSLILADERVSNGNDELPELTLRSIGMHIGGGSNSRGEKQPWLTDLFQAEGAILACQSLARQPLQGGVIGIEYYVGRSGGAPEIRSVRQQLGEAEYDQCLRLAFQKINFHQPRQPTVVSCAFRLAWNGLPD